MSNLSKVDIPVATSHRSKLDLSFSNTTTMSFMQLQPVAYFHLIKGSKISLNALANLRPAPMQVPTYGKMRCNLRGFWVPYRLVFPQWFSFYNDTIGSNFDGNAIVVDVPVFGVDCLTSLFFKPTNSATPILSQTVTASDPWDFHYGSNYYALTALGRRYYKILYSLGYDISPNPDEPYFNCLALLSLAKVYVDWYANSQFLNTADCLFIEQLLSYNDPNGQLVLNDYDVYRILSFISEALYDSNGYFEQAWSNPVAPANQQFSSFSFTDPSRVTPNAVVRTASSGSPYMSTSGVSNIGTQYVHDALRRLTDFQKRHALAGARSIDRVLAQYGMQTDYLRSMRSVYVGSKSIDINTGAVMSTGAGTNSSGASSSVGDFAGAGFGSDSHNWDFTCDEEGIFLVLATIQPSAGYYQGYDRQNRHLSKQDFFVPEFDGLGVQAIEKGEVYNSRDFDFCSDDITNYSDAFGFSGRYGEYKRSFNRVSGDFVMPSVMVGGDSWHLNRSFSDSSFGNLSGVVMSSAFVRGFDSSQYHRIFQYVNSDVDPFYCFFNFDAAVYAPCRSLFETYDFGDSSTQKVAVDSAGTKLN